jgi:hypothetical protein
MSDEPTLELPERVADKVQRVLGIPPGELSQHPVAGLIEDLCDTALMFDREEHTTVATTDLSDRPHKRSPPTLKSGEVS